MRELWVSILDDLIPVEVLWFGNQWRSLD